MKDKALAAFQTLGIELEAYSDVGYFFQYSDINFLWVYNNEKEDFLCITIPSIFKKPDDAEHEVLYYKLMDTMNASQFFVKANTVHDDIWLVYERELLKSDCDNLCAIIIRMILRLYHSLQCFRIAVENVNDDNSQEPDYSGVEVN